MIRFSVITVVRNDFAGVIRTLRSVFSQTWPHYELIVQDGASDDGTSDALRNFSGWIDSLKIEPDTGIYDAMNRALRRATGDYLLFLNADDYFVDEKVLETVAAAIDPESDQIFVGQAISDETGKVHEYRPPEKIWAGSICDHQATFIARDLMQRLEYDEAYSIAADLDFFVRARESGARFRFASIPVARKPFAVGASASFEARIRDRFPMLEKTYGSSYPVREVITGELREKTAREFDCPAEILDDLTLEDLLAAREKWSGLSVP